MEHFGQGTANKAHKGPGVRKPRKSCGLELYSFAGGLTAKAVRSFTSSTVTIKVLLLPIIYVDLILTVQHINQDRSVR